MNYPTFTWLWLWLSVTQLPALQVQVEIPPVLPAGMQDCLATDDSLRTEYIALWQSLPTLQVSPRDLQALGRLITLFPNDSDVSFVKRLLLSMFQLRHSSGAIPVDRLFEYLQPLYDPEEMIRFMDIEKTREAFELDRGLSDPEVSMAYMHAIAARLNVLEIVHGKEDGDGEAGNQVELVVRTRNGRQEEIPIFFNKNKSGPRQLTLTIAEGSRIFLRQVGDEADQQAVLAQIARRRWLTGNQIRPERLLQIQRQLAASQLHNEFASVVAHLQGVKLQGSRYKIPFTAEISRLTLIPGQYYSVSREVCETRIPMFLFLPVTIHLGIFDPELIKTLQF